MISSRSGETLLINTHLTMYTTQGREAQVGDVASFWAGRKRTIIAGRLNVVPSARSIRLLRQAGLVDAAEGVGTGEAPTASARRPTKRIDYVCVSRDIKPLAAQVLATTISDHLPVEVDVQMGS
jgi:endonuclease/exonuclease/phosphatase family metal-dependent hydrolase